MSQVDDIAAIETTVYKYIDGIAQSKPDLVAESFHPDAAMTRVADGEISFMPRCGPHIAEFMKSIPPTSEHSPNFKGRITDVRLFGTMASVEIAEDQLQGKDMKTFFQLHKGSRGWLITAKATWAPD